MARKVDVSVGEKEPLDITIQYIGVIEGVSRRGEMESYPTVMDEDGLGLKMWFAGDPADRIYYAASLSATEGWGVRMANGIFDPVIKPTPQGRDGWLTADPSVVKVPVKQRNDHTGWRYYMYYTGLDRKDGVNHVFGATSDDGVVWTKYPSTDSPYPLLFPLIPQGYGVGQSSVIWKSPPFGGMPGDYLHYYTENHGPGTFQGVRLAVSEDGIIFRDRVAVVQPGEISWDFKLHLPSNRVIGFVAIPGEVVDPHTGRRENGGIGITVSAPGSATEFCPRALVYMKDLTDDRNRWCINNGGLLGNPQGWILGDAFYYYFGSGYGIQNEKTDDGRWPDGRNPASYWDICVVKVEVKYRSQVGLTGLWPRLSIARSSPQKIF